jgi:hypothetical protein
LNDTSVTGDFEVSGNITLGTQHSNNITHVNGSLLIDMNRDIDDFNNHPQFRIHAANGEVVGSDWTKARVILDKGPNTQHAMLDIGNAASQWNYLNQFAYGEARTYINGVRKFSVSGATTEVFNNLIAHGTLTLDTGSEDTTKTLVNESGSLKWGGVAIPVTDWTAENAGVIHPSNYAIPLPTFCIWAEESADLYINSSNPRSEWNFGNGGGAYQLTQGLVIGVPSCRVISMTLSVGNTTVVPTDTATVQLTKNGDPQVGAEVTVVKNRTGKQYTEITSDITFNGGDVVNFLTLAPTVNINSTNRAVVTVWFERTS